MPESLGSFFMGPRLGPRHPTPEEVAEGAERIEELIREVERRKAMNVRCKFVCNMKDEKQGKLCFSPVYSGSEENKKFFQATPGGDIAFYTVNQTALAAFEEGKEYYVDFTPAS